MKCNLEKVIIKANEVFSFYGDKVQIQDANAEFERLKQEQAEYTLEKRRKKVGVKDKIVLPTIPKLHLPGKIGSQRIVDSPDQDQE